MDNFSPAVWLELIQIDIIENIVVGKGDKGCHKLSSNLSKRRGLTKVYKERCRKDGRST